MKSLLIIILATIFLCGCASVPKEVVELSYTLGQDISALQLSQENLIHTYFDNLRKQSNDFLENNWIPVYLEKFIQDGELVNKAKGSDSKEVLEDVQVWAQVAIEEIENRKKELIDPINKDEQVLLGVVKAAFARVINANSVITAHLNSIRKVQEGQDQLLDALQMKDIRDKINQGLIDASEKSKEAIDKINKLEIQINDAKDKKEELLNKIKGEK